MAVRKELVLYYTPEKSTDDQKLKGVLVRLGIRIRNVPPVLIHPTVVSLAALSRFVYSPFSAPYVAETLTASFPYLLPPSTVFSGLTASSPPPLPLLLLPPSP